MSEKYHGGPAFPIPLNPGVSYGGHAPCDGMTLRDYFAAAETLDDLEHLTMEGAVALAGPKPEGNWSTNPIEWRKWEAKWRAAVRFIRADAMLKAREAKP